MCVLSKIEKFLEKCFDNEVDQHQNIGIHPDQFKQTHDLVIVSVRLDDWKNYVCDGHTQKFQLPWCSQQTITSIDAQFLTYAFQHPVDFRFEIRWIVNHIKIWMTNPSCSWFIVQISSQFNTFRTACMFLHPEWNSNHTKYKSNQIQSNCIEYFKISSLLCIYYILLL